MNAPSINKADTDVFGAIAGQGQLLFLCFFNFCFGFLFSLFFCFNALLKVPAKGVGPRKIPSHVGERTARA